MCQSCTEFSKENNIKLLEEVSRRFGKERMMISISDLREFTENQDLIETYADTVLALDTVEMKLQRFLRFPLFFIPMKTDLRTFWSF